MSERERLIEILNNTQISTIIPNCWRWRDESEKGTKNHRAKFRSGNSR